MGAVVRGGRHLEDLAKADVFVFDKTGTLTMANPSVKEIIPCNGWTYDEALRLAACLEEHFPHPVAKAVVRHADIEGLDLMALPALRNLATATLGRVQNNFTFIVATNSFLLFRGLLGHSSPALGALLHNSTTIAAAVNAIRPYSLPPIPETSK